MKRFLSILLAVMLVCTLIPVASAATVAENGNTVYNYVFSASAVGFPAGTEISHSNYVETLVSPLDGGVVDYDDIVASVSDKWDIITFRYMQVRKLQNKGLYLRAAKADAKIPYNNGIAIKISVPENGKYIPKVLFDGANNGGIVQAYFFSEKTRKMTNSDSIKSLVSGGSIPIIGSVDTYAQGASDDKIQDAEITIDATAVDLEAGDHYLVVVFNGANETVLAGPSGYYYMNLKGLRLEKVAPASVSVTSSANEIEVGGSATVSAKAYDANNNELPDEIAFSSSDSTVATVDAVTGAVSAVAPGVATITATAKGTTVSSSVTITVTKTYKYIFSGNASGYANGTGFTTGDIIDYSHVEAKGISAPWDYIGQRSMAVAQLRTNGFYARAATNNLGGEKNGLVFKIKISENGVYVPTLKYSGYSNGGTVAVIFANASEVDALSYDMTDGSGGGGIVRAIGKYAPAGSVNTRNSAITNENFGSITPYPMNNVNLVKGEYYLIFTLPDSTERPVNGSYVYFLVNSVELKKVDNYTPAEDGTLSDAFDYTEDEFTSAPLSTATVNTFTATLGQSADKDTAVITSQTVNLGELCTVEAPAAEEGYKFLYWAKGMSTDKKQIVSYNESYSFIPTVENTYLIAVYEAVNGENEVNKAEFYNANGQLIETLTENGTAPALPEMAGYNGAEGWALYGSDEVIAAGADVEVDGTKVYVAKFGNPKPVKVNETDVAYGDKVSFKASPAIGQIFKCWKKDGVIVSTDETYEFYAWKDATVEAVYVTEGFTFSGIARKILIDTFATGGKSSVMAEFIGFEDAVEKGIMLGTKRFAMTTDASQFTLVNDIDATEVTGYAIFKDGTIVLDK